MTMSMPDGARINCGDIVDPVIAEHRRMTSQAAASQSGIDNRVRTLRLCSLYSGELVAPRLYLASPAEVDRPLCTPRRGLSPQ